MRFISIFDRSDIFDHVMGTGRQDRIAGSPEMAVTGPRRMGKRIQRYNGNRVCDMVGSVNIDWTKPTG
ncbi:hypothetical protein DO021_14560 [Desulfobacter hydrogenophilus]|uniref:Uncharacterized protein n=1 Tax=Desulfobacter hydrogenophilus TaxID=2291 RepID=A0A328F9E5_9BACT|nr:hypothetical protein [Desulfobacter hydrogenophilus]NDY72588.1 hypothetical protein [Desulfobacter hydrogenophilus]QBH13309.1 hypothetical protein EYB58_10475 [Desulfobacter hydrogenophilus]RAM01294.1 hypothetical protein DO021_14560 [Desulfobacter hydrogenophilus]